jgi:phage FluMu gp28-like protein
MLADAVDENAAKPELYERGLATLGRDVATRKGGDLSVIHVTEIVGPMLWLRERWTKQGAKFAEQDDVMDGMFKRYHILRAGIDQTGMGEKVVEDAISRHGERVQGVLFTGPNRLDLALSLLKRFEDRAIRIPNDARLKRDLRAIKKVKGPADVPRIINEGEVHADEFWALALCALMAGDDIGMIEFQAAGTKSAGHAAYGDQPAGPDMGRGFGVVPGNSDFEGF